METRDPRRDEGGRTDRQPGSNPQHGDDRPDPRKTRETGENGDNPRQDPRQDPRPEQPPKSA